MSAPTLDADVLVVGAGPAGLSAALELRRRGVASVLVVERDEEPGGVPRFCEHQGFGVLDLHRALSGPAYADLLVRQALDAGVTILTGTSARQIDDAGAVTLVSGAGIQSIATRRTIIASGARERPRSARLIAGDRSAGVFTTGQLQRWVHEKHFPVGQRALVLGAEHVSYSAVLTLREAGVRTVAMTTELERHQSLAGASLLATAVLRVPLFTSSRVARINGRGRVESADIENLVTGLVRRVEVDTVVLSADWIPEVEFARSSGVEISRSTKGALVDGEGRTSREGVYAVGTLVQPGETAGVAARCGREVGARVADSLAGAGGDRRGGLVVTHDESIRWVVPERVAPGDAPERCYLRTGDFTSRRTVVVRQGGRELARRRLRHSTPNRGLSFSGEWVQRLDQGGGPVSITLE